MSDIHTDYLRLAVLLTRYMSRGGDMDNLIVDDTRELILAARRFQRPNADRNAIMRHLSGMLKAYILTPADDRGFLALQLPGFRVRIPL